MSEKIVTIFGGSATLILGLPLVTGQLTMSIVGQGGNAWSQVFTYDPAARIMETDSGKLAEAILSYGAGLGPFLRGVMVVSDAIIRIVDFFVSIIRGVLGSVVGIGLTGIFIVLMLTLISLMIGLYALYTLAPLLLLSYGLRSLKRSRLRAQEESVTREAMALFQEASSSSVPKTLVPQPQV